MYRIDPDKPYHFLLLHNLCSSGSLGLKSVFTTGHPSCQVIVLILSFEHHSDWHHSNDMHELVISLLEKPEMSGADKASSGSSNQGSPLLLVLIHFVNKIPRGLVDLQTNISMCCWLRHSISLLKINNNLHAESLHLPPDCHSLHTSGLCG